MTQSSSPDATRVLAGSLPKVLLHEHLDGGLRLETLQALLAARGLPAPAATTAALADWFRGNAHAGSLVKYLEGFALTVSAMATLDGMARVAFEAAEDARADGVVLAEFRMAPQLFEPHGLSAEAATEALLDGLARSPLPCGLIICGLRHENPAYIEEAARLAVRFRDRGVVAFDLAGPEAGFPPDIHAGALKIVRDADLPITLHAGEADAAERVVQAGRLGAKRIGHGVRLVDALHDPARRHLVDEVLAMGLHLEVCPTSNVHTGAAPSIAQHPITELWRAGIDLSYHTDNRLISCLSVTDEAEALLTHTPLQADDLLSMAERAARASFMPAAAREQALQQVKAARSALAAAA